MRIHCEIDTRGTARLFWIQISRFYIGAGAPRRIYHKSSATRLVWSVKEERTCVNVLVSETPSVNRGQPMMHPFKIDIVVRIPDIKRVPSSLFDLFRGRVRI